MEREPGRRWRAVAVIALGGAAIAVAAAFVASKAGAKTEVDLLVDVLRGGDRADAVWAFERLKALAPARLDELAEHVDDASPTPLVAAGWTSVGRTSVMKSVRPMSVGRILRYVIAYELEAGQMGPPEDELSPETRKALEARRPSAGARALRWIGRVVSPPPRVLPPSADPAGARQRAEGDARGLADLLRGGDPALAQWAFEVLRTLPDPALSALLPRIGSRETSNVTWLYADRPGTVAEEQGCSLGLVVRYILAHRVGGDEVGNWATDPISGESLRSLEEAWRERRKAAGEDGAPIPRKK